MFGGRCVGLEGCGLMLNLLLQTKDAHTYKHFLSSSYLLSSPHPLLPFPLHSSPPFPLPILSSLSSSLSLPDWFVLTLLILFPLNLYIGLAPANWWSWFWGVMQLEPPTSLSFRITIIEIALIYCTIAYLLEVRVCKG